IERRHKSLVAIIALFALGKGAFLAWRIVHQPVLALRFLYSAISKRGPRKGKVGQAAPVPSSSSPHSYCTNYRRASRSAWWGHSITRLALLRRKSDRLITLRRARGDGVSSSLTAKH